MNQLAKDYSDLGIEFVAFVKSKSDAELSKPGPENEWTAAFAIHHLADFEIHFASRFLRIITEENPEIQSYDESLYVDKTNYATRNVRTSIQTIEATRKQLGEILGGLNDQDFDRPVRHAEKGQIKLSDLIGYCNNHIKNHLDQVKSTL
ncbi:MAG: DinB family protein [Candidatus Nanopelagicales bacterium]